MYAGVRYDAVVLFSVGAEELRVHAAMRGCHCARGIFAASFCAADPRYPREDCWLMGACVRHRVREGHGARG